MSFFRWLGLAVFAVLLSGCMAEGRIGVSLITNGRHDVQPGLTVDGHLIILGGRLDVADGATLAGSAFVIGGDLRLDGRVGGDLTVLSGSAALGPEAVVDGDLRLAGGSLDRDDGAVVAGQVVTGVDADAALGLVRPNSPSPTEQLIRFSIQLVALLVLAGLTVRWLPQTSDRIGEAIRRRTLLVIAVGLLAVLIGLPLVVFMAFTVVLIPLALLLALGYGLALAVAWVALGRQLGGGLQRWSGRFPSSMAQALSGTLVLTVSAGLVGLVPLVGDVVIIAILVSCIGGAVITRLGTATAPQRPA